MRIVLLSNEYPPHIYGGAGVHVGSLSRELVGLEDGKHSLQVLCFGDQSNHSNNTEVRGVGPAPSVLSCQDPRHAKLLDALHRNILMAASAKDGDILHCHTWYTHLAGCLLKQLLDIPLVITTHSLEPRRPWKEEQLGSGYGVSTWLEKTALLNADGIIAVSEAMRTDVHELYGIPLQNIRTIHNGIDANRFKPTYNQDILVSYGINPQQPYILFVGRITRQKGIVHLLHALPYLDTDAQVVLCAGAPDTGSVAAEMKERVDEVRTKTANRIVWISDIVPEDDLVVLYSHASLLVCPSVYEPFGIINLEAMACNTPVVASDVGGIPEIVVDNETGLLVGFESKDTDASEPKSPELFSRDLAAAINRLLASPEKIETMGRKARERVEQHFAWQRVAEKTLAYYRHLIDANDKVHT